MIIVLVLQVGANKWQKFFMVSNEIIVTTIVVWHRWELRRDDTRRRRYTWCSWCGYEELETLNVGALVSPIRTISDHKTSTAYMNSMNCVALIASTLIWTLRLGCRPARSENGEIFIFREDTGEVGLLSSKFELLWCPDGALGGVSSSPIRCSGKEYDSHKLICAGIIHRWNVQYFEKTCFAIQKS